MTEDDNGTSEYQKVVAGCGSCYYDFIKCVSVQAQLALSEFNKNHVNLIAV